MGIWLTIYLQGFCRNHATGKANWNKFLFILEEKQTNKYQRAAALRTAGRKVNSSSTIGPRAQGRAQLYAFVSVFEALALLKKFFFLSCENSFEFVFTNYLIAVTHMAHMSYQHIVIGCLTLFLIFNAFWFICLIL